jgi:hypothetical protein
MSNPDIHFSENNRQGDLTYTMPPLLPSPRRKYYCQADWNKTMTGAV